MEVGTDARTAGYRSVDQYRCRADTSIAVKNLVAYFHQGNIYKDSFVDVWNNGFKEYRNREWARKGQCADCDMFRYCEGSGMHLHDDSGDLITCHYRRIEN